MSSNPPTIPPRTSENPFSTSTAPPAPKSKKPAVTHPDLGSTARMLFPQEPAHLTRDGLVATGTKLHDGFRAIFQQLTDLREEVTADLRLLVRTNLQKIIEDEIRDRLKAEIQAELELEDNRIRERVDNTQQHQDPYKLADRVQRLELNRRQHQG
ncbi:MAG: hypothetical protein M1839_002055 [Geoglossum umbratile]|nr:MAG: hypothetical protein M1839_002055 [Geoglossum umbratile]